MTATPAAIAFRVDASRVMGIGHFIRCLTLADGFAARGARCRFVSRSLPEHLRAMLREHGHEFAPCSEGQDPGAGDDVPHSSWLGASQAADAEETIALLSDQRWQWLVVDHYALDARWEKRLQQVTSRVMVIDDLADRVHECDLLLDQNLYVDSERRYIGKVSARCELRLGPRYALVRDEFRVLRGGVGPRSGPIRRVLVFLGGMDVEDYTSRALRAIVRTGVRDLHVDVVIGAGHPHVARVRALSTEYGFSCYVQTERMPELMAAADLSIGAGGSATWERCCLRLPAIVFAIAGNQEIASQALAGYGAICLGAEASFDADIDQAFRYLGVPSHLNEMSVKAGSLVDGLGVTRICDTVFEGMSG